MPSINGIVSSCPSEARRKHQKINKLRDWESVIRWNLTCKRNSSKGTGVAE
jgi:hypothetical protein